MAITRPVPAKAVGVTSLTDPKVEYQQIEGSHVKLQRANTQVIIINNAAVDLPGLPGHRAGYNGIGSLTHKMQRTNAFVPSIAGLNFEHIHDGTKVGLIEKFEPRKFPMHLRRINDHTVELYQPPTGNWKLESCGRYTLLDDGTIEYTFECIPHQANYAKGYIGLFWASYINEPADKAIHFRGRLKSVPAVPDWIKAISPKHGVDSTHPPASRHPSVEVDPDFPLTLVGHPSKYEYTDSWYYGISKGMALAFMFSPKDNIWFAQSPSGGGNGNPAWDFQWFIHAPQVGKAYGFTMRLAYLPYANREQLIKHIEPHRVALQHQ